MYIIVKEDVKEITIFKITSFLVNRSTSFLIAPPPKKFKEFKSNIKIKKLLKW